MARNHHVGRLAVHRVAAPGAPHLNLTGNLALFCILVAHLYAVIWNDITFRIFGGDRFTYGSVSLFLNLSSVLINFSTVWVTLHLGDKRIDRVTEISPYSWGLIFESLLMTVIMPILSHRRAVPFRRSPSGVDSRSPRRDDEGRSMARLGNWFARVLASPRLDISPVRKIIWTT